MNILYIHQYFKTPSEPGGTRSYWIAKELIKNGHHVTMVTSKENNNFKVEKKIIEGINVIYLREEYSQRMGIFRRLKAFFGFGLKSSIEAFKQKDIDLVIATSTPLTVGIPALMLKWAKGVPYIFEVRDLWPEVPIQMGALKMPILKNLAIFFEKTIYKNAKHVIALSPGMQKGVTRYVNKEKVTIIPNMSKIDKFWHRKKNVDLIKNLGLTLDSFKVIHFGSLGLANGADYIIEAAKLIKDDHSIQFLFVGGGSTEEELKNECEKFNLKNVFFLGKFPMEELSDIVNICDVSLITFKDLPILYTNSPNKLFDSLSAGKPIIVNSAGWTKDLVEENNCGYYVNPNDPNDLIARIKKLQSDADLVNLMGKNSRKLAETTYDKSILSEKFSQVISNFFE